MQVADTPSSPRMIGSVTLTTTASRVITKKPSSAANRVEFAFWAPRRAVVASA
ncbi:hypothetical protein M6B22_06460 [Jatrophihabitans cynanchi]|jgi:hypothetical protein|uniref:Uncharacterized protein n=1 Tax=Jatrophihabitans cynanchi TaxID=2944128 RepID=A0ABY7K0M2_9ACTN|nr:hypothetical protein [Jatrophihabitans sp. SB3-54]WAX58403.1 hypothetical protein M6B22_06460 [Jatrophihabitans sp. SB3-54]